MASDAEVQSWGLASASTRPPPAASRPQPCPPVPGSAAPGPGAGSARPGRTLPTRRALQTGTERLQRTLLGAEQGQERVPASAGGCRAGGSAWPRGCHAPGAAGAGSHHRPRSRRPAEPELPRTGARAPPAGRPNGSAWGARAPPPQDRDRRQPGRGERGGRRGAAHAWWGGRGQVRAWSMRGVKAQSATWEPGHAR